MERSTGMFVEDRGRLWNTPTYPQSKLTSNLDDYGKKGSIRSFSAVAGFQDIEVVNHQISRR